MNDAVEHRRVSKESKMILCPSGYYVNEYECDMCGQCRPAPPVIMKASDNTRSKSGAR